MPFRDRVKRLRTRVNRVLRSPSFGSTSTPSVESAVASASVPPYGIEFASASRVGIGGTIAQQIELSPGALDTLSTGNVNNSLHTGQGIPFEPPSLVASSQDPPPYGNPSKSLRRTLGPTGVIEPTSSLRAISSTSPLSDSPSKNHTLVGSRASGFAVGLSSSSLAPEAIPPESNSTPTPVGRAWKHLGDLRRVLDSIPGGFGPLKYVIDELGRLFDIHEDAARARQDYGTLKAELEQLFSALSGHFAENTSPIMTTSINNLCTAIENELDQISTKEERRMGTRYLEAGQDLDDIMKCYQRIRGHLERLKLNADLNMWRIIDEQASESRLKSLAPSMSACYNSVESHQVGRRECTPETRKQVLEDLSHWRRDKTKENMYWLNGMAGTGKTTIASSLCAMLAKSHELGASFFCTRLLPECRDAKLILSTIAYQLARFSRPFYHALSLALQADPDLHTKVLSSQLDGLIITPLRNVVHSLPTNLVVVIDALDECEDSQAVGMLLELLAGCAADLPIKLFVSSRPEPQIRHKIGKTKLQIILHELEHSIVKEDIGLYLRTELKDLVAPISDADLTTLAERSGILFIYAATAVRYIKSTSLAPLQRKRIQAVLSVVDSSISDKNKAIDMLYGTILASAFDFSEFETDDKTIMKLVLDTVVCAQEPLTVGALAVLLGLEDSAWVQAALEPLWSVLHVYGTNGVVATLHASFSDYMFDPKRSGDHGCQAEAHNGRIAELCFDRIKSNRQQFNICGLESSFVFDEQVPNLEERVQRMVPQDLLYACRHWATHLELGGPSAPRLKQLNELLSDRLLLWVEVLNLKKQTNICVLSLAKARSWCQKETTSRSLNDLVHDAWRFVTMFATSEVSRSTPHLYLSMLASWPSSGPVAYHYVRRTRGLTEVGGTGMTRRQLALLSTWTVGAAASSVSFSPDGTRIISGSTPGRLGVIGIWDAASGNPAMSPIKLVGEITSVAFSPDGTRIAASSFDRVHVCSAKTGEPLMEPLQGHTDTIESISFSPDGMYIVAGSGDKTMRIWDATSGKLAIAPLRGHSGRVLSVAFSPDNKRIVSGSADFTIRVWDPITGKQSIGSLQGHFGFVTSVAFSSDGVTIASGSQDCTVRVWDATTSKLVLGPLVGHTGTVGSVAFSPNGTWIASASNDCTIRVWNTANGDLLMGPLQGHTTSVESIAFSPDNTRIASISHDGTICVWDPMSGKPTSDPLEGHSGSVNSVAFSPDGTRIVSGSTDKTIRLWDVASGKPKTAALTGHTGGILSVAFSPNGMHVVSGSSDHTIRVWDARDGRLVMSPLQGHVDSVKSVAFSPNGTHIVSSSSDCTIRAWDGRNGKLVMGPLDRHHKRVVSEKGVDLGDASSPDYSAVQLWNAAMKKPAVSQPMLRRLRQIYQSDSNPVVSITFTPDGMYLISVVGGNRKPSQALQPGPVSEWLNRQKLPKALRSTDEGTSVAAELSDPSRPPTCVWSAATGDLVAQLDPLVGNDDVSPILLSLSHDGSYIASGSNDNKIHIWTTKDKNSAPTATLGGHTDWVGSVSFSPNGRHIASGSRDNTIRIWDSDKWITKQAQKRANAVHHGSWSLNEDGWAIDENQQLLLWLPLDLQHRVLDPGNTCLISTEGSIELSFKGANIGESWAKCYVPIP